MWVGVGQVAPEYGAAWLVHPECWLGSARRCGASSHI